MTDNQKWMLGIAIVAVILFFGIGHFVNKSACPVSGAIFAAKYNRILDDGTPEEKAATLAVGGVAYVDVCQSVINQYTTTTTTGGG